MKEVKISSEQTLKIFNILRSIGLNTNKKGTIILYTAIKYNIFQQNDDDFINLKELYKLLSKKYNLTEKNIANLISYSLNHRIEEIAQKNFEKIFHCTYDDSFFLPSSIIDEITRIIKINA